MKVRHSSSALRVVDLGKTEREGKERKMDRPCGTDECYDWVYSEGYSEVTDAVCYVCGMCGPMFDWMNKGDSDDDDENC